MKFNKTTDWISSICSKQVFLNLILNTYINNYYFKRFAQIKIVSRDYYCQHVLYSFMSSTISSNCRHRLWQGYISSVGRPVIKVFSSNFKRSLLGGYSSETYVSKIIQRNHMMAVTEIIICNRL